MTTEERIEKMERQLVQVRWFNRCLIACIVLSLGVWFIMKTERAWAQFDTKEIRANKFVLEDLKGKTRAELKADNNWACLTLKGADGGGRVVLGFPGGGSEPKLMLIDRNDKVCAELSLEKGQPSMWLRDRNDKVRASLTVTENGPNLLLMDEKGKPIWSAPERFRVIPIK